MKLRYESHSSVPRQSLDDLAAFLAVARAGSFTHAAPELGVSQSALSHSIRRLEARLGVRLLTRTTRSVAPTEAGVRLLRTLAARVEGRWVFSSSPPMLQAALVSVGLAYLPEDMVLEHVAAGRLLRVLDDWCEPFAGYHLYYASRRQSSRALAVVIEALRHQG